MAVPRQTMEKDLEMEERGLSDELNGLNKKAKPVFSEAALPGLQCYAVQVPREAIQRRPITITGSVVRVR